MTDRPKPHDWEWVQAAAKREEELGEFPPNGAGGGVVARHRRAAEKAALGSYFEIVDTLREQRRAPDRNKEDDRALLARLEDLYDELSEAGRAEVESQGWRSWPDLFDGRSRGRQVEKLFTDAHECAARLDALQRRFVVAVLIEYACALTMGTAEADALIGLTGDALVALLLRSAHDDTLAVSSLMRDLVERSRQMLDPAFKPQSLF